jgi:hypothetical protein
MNKMDLRIKIKNESKERVKSISFGDEVTNICAGEGNPGRHCYFVEYKKNTRKNKCGLNHTEHLAKLTDRKGSFWDCDIEVVHPGFLDRKECEELFNPVWQSHYG